MNKFFIFILVVFSFFLIISCTQNVFYGLGEDTDIESPQVNVVSPDNNDIVSTYFTITGTAKDDKALATITIASKSGYYQRLSAKASWSADIDASNLTDGNHKFQVTVKDEAGKKATVDLDVIIDKTGPVITVYSPELNENESEATRLSGIIGFVGTAKDPISGINYSSGDNVFTLTRQSDNQVIFQETINSETWSFLNFDIQNEQEGNYTLDIRARDLQGNTGTFSRLLTFTHEIDQPSVYIQYPRPQVNPPDLVNKFLMIHGYALDNRGITRIYYNIEDSNENFIFTDFREIATDKVFSASIDITELNGGGGLDNGSYYVVARALDDNGNYSDDARVAFTVDDTVPTVSFLDSLTTPSGNTPQELTYHSTDVSIDIISSSLEATVTYEVIQGSTTFGPETITDFTGNIGTFSIDVSDLIDNQGFNDGTITVKITATKEEKFSYAARAFIIDVTPPEISIESHQNYDDVNGGVVLAGTAYDERGLDTTIDIYTTIDGWIGIPADIIWSHAISTDDPGNDIETLFGVALDTTADEEIIVRARDKAGNVTTSSIILTIDPNSDRPTITRLMPVYSGVKVSGSLTILFALNDDDFPGVGKDITGTIKIFDDTTELTTYTENYTISGTVSNPKMSKIIDTNLLEDGKTYTIKANCVDWHGKAAVEETCTFVVDKNIPEFTLTTPDESVGDIYISGDITFSGKIKDNNTITSLTLSYIDADGSTDARSFELTPEPMEAGKNVWSFNGALLSSLVDTGFTDGDEINWGDDAWGNKQHLFTLRATDETGLSAYKYLVVHFDNHQPTVTISSPGEGDIIAGTDMEISGTLSDTPGDGVGFGLSYDMVQIELYKSGVEHLIIKSFEGSNANFLGTPASFIYNWDFSGLGAAFADDSDYSIRIKAKDNAGNVQSSIPIVNFKKNQNPPEIQSIVYTTKDYYRDSFTISVDAVDNGGGSGVTKVEMYVDDVLKETILNAPVDSDFNEVFTINTSADYTDGVHDIMFRVTDVSDLTRDSSVKTFHFDNVAPTITTPVFYVPPTEVNTVTAYSSYIGFTLDVTDDNYITADNLRYTAVNRTTSEVLADDTLEVVGSSGTTTLNVRCGSIDLTTQDATIDITITARDKAGNDASQMFSIEKAAILPQITVDYSAYDNYVSDMIDNGTANGTTVITGTVSTADAGDSIDRIIVKEGITTLDDIVSLDAGTGNFTITFNNGDISEEDHTYTITAITANHVENTESFTLICDNTAPTIAITEITADPAGGNVVITDSSHDVSGAVLIKGTYLDNDEDVLADHANIQININNNTWLTVPQANIIVNKGGTWTWTYNWNTEVTTATTAIVQNDITIAVKASDRGLYEDYDDLVLDVIPHITDLTTDTAALNTYPVYEVKTYSNSEWAHHADDMRYTLVQDGDFIIMGYNLSTANVVLDTTPDYIETGYVGTQQIKASMPAEGVSGTIHLDAGGILSDNSVKVYLWNFTKMGDTTDDTLDAYGYDMNLKTDGKAFITFARDHQTGSYTGFANDYSTYRITEGTDTAYNSFGHIDPCWFTSSILLGDYMYMTTCVDEWDAGANAGVKRIPSSTSYIENINQEDTIANGADNLNDFDIPGPSPTTDVDNTELFSSSKNSTQLNTLKSGSMAYNGTDGVIYSVVFDDDSREGSPVPTLFLASLSMTNTYYLPDTAQVRTVAASSGSEIVGEWNAVAVTAQNRPAITYVYNDSLRFSVGTSATPLDDAFETNANVNEPGGKYNSLTIDTVNDIIHISHQTSSYDLSYGVLDGTDDASPSFITLETAHNEGISGFNTSITLDDTKQPYISYINNTEVNTTAGLHMARYTGSIEEAQLSTQGNWEYMTVPSIAPVNADKTIIKWDENNDWPVIAFKANDVLYIARMVQ